MSRFSPGRPGGAVLIPCFLLLAGPACKSSDPAPEAASEKATEEAPADSGETDPFLKLLAQGMAIPQEELAKKPDRTITLSGTLTVPDYVKGRIQVDVFRVKGEDQNLRPATNARFDKPGPYTLLLPKGLGKIKLGYILDLDSDGPGRTDPRGDHPDNPIAAGDSDLTGIDFTLDTTAVVPTPPMNQPPQPGDPNAGNAAAIDTEDTSEIILHPDGAGAPGAAPGAAPAPAPPGAPGGDPAGGAAGAGQPAAGGAPAPR